MPMCENSQTFAFDYSRFQMRQRWTERSVHPVWLPLHRAQIYIPINTVRENFHYPHRQFVPANQVIHETTDTRG